MHATAPPSQPHAGEDRMEIVEGGGEPAGAKERITTRYLTKYEKARVLGTRALQISMNAPVMVDVGNETGKCVFLVVFFCVCVCLVFWWWFFCCWGGGEHALACGMRLTQMATPST
jgi:hypothetical protein